MVCLIIWIMMAMVIGVDFLITLMKKNLKEKKEAKVEKRITFGMKKINNMCSSGAHYLDWEEIEELERLFSKLNSLELPISQNNCLIIEKILDFKDNKEFIDSLLYNLKNNKRDFYFFENGKKYEICLDDNKLWSIERIIINYIQSKTKDEFEAFVYANSKN